MPGRVSNAEWTQKRKDGTLVPVEVSSNILPDGRWQAFVRDISERKRIEDLRQVFVSLLDNSSDFIGVADPNGNADLPQRGRPATWSDWRRMIRSSRWQIQDCYPPELRAFVTDVILKTMIERGQWSGETYFQNIQTHEKIPVSDTHFLIRDASGEASPGLGHRHARHLGGAADRRRAGRLLATNRPRAEQAEAANAQLRESEERFRLTIDEAPIGMALVALDGRLGAREPGALRDHRLQRGRADAADISGHHPSRRSRHGCRSWRVGSPVGRSRDISSRSATSARTGRSSTSCSASSVLRGPDGAARYYIAQIEDITARKRADEAVRLSEAKFSGIVSIAADAIISVDEKQRITIFNEGARAIFGYTKDEAIGMPLDRLIPERLRASAS